MALTLGPAVAGAAQRSWPFQIVPGRLWPAVCPLALIVVGDTPIRRRASDAVVGGGSAVDFAILIEIGVYGLVGAWLALRVASGFQARRLPPLLMAMWAFITAMGITVLYAPNPPLAAVRMVELIVAGCVATAMYRRGPADVFERFATGYVVTLTGLIGLGLVVRFPVTAEASRFTWLYTHPVTAGALLALSCLLLLEGRVLSNWLTSRPVTRWSLAVVHLTALAVNQSRGSAAAFLLGFLVWAWFRSGRRERNAILVILVVALPLFAILVQDIVGNFITRGQSSDRLLSVNSRTDLWTAAVEAVSDRIVTGAGFAASRQVFLEEIGLGGAHNAHIEVLVNGGLLGVVPWAILLLATFATAWRLARSHPAGAILLGVYTTMMVNSMTSQAISQAGTGSIVIFMVLVAWMARVEATLNGPWEVRRS